MKPDANASATKGFRIEHCRRIRNCPNRALETEQLVENIADLVKSENLYGFLKSHIKGPLKYHHELKIGIADCPNGCPQPQIKDIGIIAAAVPMLGNMPCTLCEACALKCKEHAITIDRTSKIPLIDNELCVNCGQCIKACPIGTLIFQKKGFRIQVGGKLGRHPQLAVEIPGVFNEEESLLVLSACISFYKKHGKGGQRFGAVIHQSGFEELITLCTKRGQYRD